MKINAQPREKLAPMYKIVRRLIPKYNNLIKLIVILVDLLLVLSSYFISFIIRFMDLPEYNTEPFIAAIPPIALSFIIYADIFGLMKLYRKSRRQMAASVFKLVFMQALTTTSIAYFMQGFSFPRTVLLISVFTQATLLIIWNWIILSMRDRYADNSQALIIGREGDVKTVSEKLNYLTNMGKLNIKYTFSPDEKDRCVGAIKKSRIDAVYICPGMPEDIKTEILLLCMNQNVIVYLVPEIFDLALLNSGVINFNETPLIFMDRLSLSYEQRFIKRLFDLTVTIAALPVLLPFLLGVAACVKLTSPGRVLYSQERVTNGGHIYRIYKFRTMHEDAELLTGPVISSEDDVRVTPFGKFLRRCHIDEFPQLINVLKGEMSLVGPRSERPYFVERFTRDIDGYTIRSHVKAGLTGYAQIFGNYDTEAGLKLKYDILYIKNYSLLLDIKLIFQTFDTIIRKWRK